MKIQTEALRTAFEIADLVPANPAVESSQFVRIRQDGKTTELSLCGSTRATSRATSEDEGKWAAWIDRRPLKAFLSTASGKHVDATWTKDKTILRSGQRLEVAARSPVSGYESWKPGEGFSLSVEQISAARLCAKFLPTAAGCENVEAVWFAKDFGVVGTDTIFLSAVLGKLATDDLFVPAGIADISERASKMAVDANGIGAVLPAGTVYQPFSSDLDNYPKEPLKEMISKASKAKPFANASARALKDVFSVADQFVMDKDAGARIEPVAGGIQIVVDTGTGKFQRTIKTSEEVVLATPPVWNVKRAIPWLETILATDEDARIDLAQLADAGALRCKRSKLLFVLTFADI